MARDKTIKFLRTTRSNLDTQKNASNLIIGEPYLITDESRLAIGTANNDYTDLAKKSEVDAKKTDNVSTASRILGRKTSGAGAIEELTLSEVMDFIGSAAEGDILYRGASSWARLPKGSNGQVLTLASGLPSWANASGGGLSYGYALRADFTTTGSSKVDVTNLTVDVEANKKYSVLFAPRFKIGSSQTLLAYIQAPTSSRYSGNYHSLDGTDSGIFAYQTSVPYIQSTVDYSFFNVHLLIETVNSGTIKIQVELYPGTNASGLYVGSLFIVREIN